MAFPREISKTFYRAISLFTTRQKIKLGVLAFSQSILGVLDLIGVGLFGVLGALAVSGVQSRNPSGKVLQVIKFFSLEHCSLQRQVTLIAILSTLILVLRTAFSVVLNRTTLLSLSNKSAELSTRLLKNSLSSSLISLSERTSQMHIYAQTSGVNALTIGILGAGTSFVSDFVLLLLMFSGIAFLDLQIAALTFIFFSAVGYALQKLLQQKARSLGVQGTELSIAANQKTVEVMELFREILVRNRRGYYVETISKLRFRLARVTAEIAFLPSISKYVLESASVVGVLLISGFLFTTKDAQHAVAYLSIFMAASSRIVPAVLRIQQSFLSVKFNLGIADSTLSQLENHEARNLIDFTQAKFDTNHKGFNPFVVLTEVSFKYSSSGDFAIQNLNLNIAPGQLVAIVGPSGSGKSTLVDLILGIHEPNSGSVCVSGISPKKAAVRWPGAMSYVSQETRLFSGTIRENLLMGYSETELSQEVLEDAIQRAKLDEFIASLPDGFETKVGENGNRLSGGQKQRLSIARALVTKPSLLVMDEATSSLDAQTEHEISAALNALRGQVTQIWVAHRLSTVMRADQVLYLSDGKVIASGTFDEIRKLVPNFEKQAKLMGL